MTLIGVNVAIFIGVLLFTRDPGALTGSVTDAHLRLGVSRDVLAQQIAWQSADGVFITEPDEWYRLVTSGFMHFGIIHLAFNMYFLYSLGRMLEPALGRVLFLLLYMAALLGGSLGVIVMGGAGITAGASGAVFGLLAAATIGLVAARCQPLQHRDRRHTDPQSVHHVRDPRHLHRGPSRRHRRRLDLRPGDARAALQELSEMGVVRHPRCRRRVQRDRLRHDRDVVTS